ncbi:DUF2239 family protein [Candidatus Bipolaricaulota bacterium]|nr:DUF2239 family protein [Candidatus Bipolaricaulota bacterium]
MTETTIHPCTAFEGDQRIASGELLQVVRRAKQAIDRKEHASVLIFDDSTSEVIDVDYRGTEDDVVRRLEEESGGTGNGSVTSSPPPDSSVRRGPGRPRLGVVSGEVTLLPRHWAWLKSQPGGASVTLRKLVEEARKLDRLCDSVRRSQEATFRFMTVMAGNLDGYEEAARSLFAGDRKRFDDHTNSWPTDVRDYARKLAEAAFGNGGGSQAKG